MMGYNDGGEIYLPTTNNDSFSGSRKLRPLIPRPPPPHHHRFPNPTTNPHIHQYQGRHSHGHGHNQPCLGRGVNNSDHFLALNHHLATMAEHSKRELKVTQQVVVSSRWNPTPEQLRTLEDLWRRGTRTPSADEIQQITSRLRRYGKIEGKNVFYWFQNHKARERQKRRRQMESGGCPDQEENDYCETGNLSHKDSDTGGSPQTASEDVRRSNNNDTPINNNNNNWGNPHFLNSSEPAIEKEGKLAVGGGTASTSSSAVVSVSSSSVVTSLRMKKSNDNDSISARALLLHSPNSNIFTISGTCCRDEDNDDDDDLNVPVGWHYLTATPPGSFFTYPSTSCRPLLGPPCPTTAGRVIVTVPPEMTASRSSSPSSSSPLPNHEFQTLQLFPLRSRCDGEEDYAEGFGGRRDDDEDRVTGIEFAASNGHVDHHQFFEFLPLKN